MLYLRDTDDSAYRQSDSKVLMAKKKKFPKTPKKKNIREKTKQSPKIPNMEKNKIPIPGLICCFLEMSPLD